MSHIDVQLKLKLYLILHDIIFSFWLSGFNSAFYSMDRVMIVFPSIIFYCCFNKYYSYALTKQMIVH